MADNRGDGNAMCAVWCGDELQAGGWVLVRGIAAPADAGGVGGGSGGVLVPELFGETAT